MMIAYTMTIQNHRMMHQIRLFRSHIVKETKKKEVKKTKKKIEENKKEV